MSNVKPRYIVAFDDGMFLGTDHDKVVINQSRLFTTIAGAKNSANWAIKVYGESEYNKSFDGKETYVVAEIDITIKDVSQ